MAVSNEMIALFILVLFGYLMYTTSKNKGHKLFGNICFSSAGIGMMYYGVVVLAEQYIFAGVGLILLLGGLVNGIIDILKVKKE